MARTKASLLFCEFKERVEPESLWYDKGRNPISWREEMYCDLLDRMSLSVGRESMFCSHHLRSSEGERVGAMFVHSSKA